MVIVLTEMTVADIGLKGKKIIIDAGHGPDLGAVGLYGLTERELNLKVAKYLSQYLTDAGATVVMTREDDSGPYSGRTVAAHSLAARVKMATEEKCDLFLSIHHNANAQADRSVNQIEVFYNIYDFGPSKDAAQYIYDSLVNELHIPKGYPTVMPAEYYVLRKAVGYPAVLGEAAFIINPQAELLLRTEEYQQKEAKAYFEGIKRYFDAGILTITKLQPADGEILTDTALPRISAELTEEKGGPGIDIDSIQVKLDEKPVSFQLRGNKINYIPEKPLTNGEHTITIDARNKKGNAAMTAKSTFLVQLPPEQIEVKVEPKQIPPDGNADVLITAMVKDKHNNPIGDGVLVTFLADNRYFGKALTHQGNARIYYPGKPFMTTTPIVAKTQSKTDITTLESNLDSLGMIIGTVKTRTGTPIPNATIKLVENAIGTTNSDGWFYISELGAGEYPLSIESNGYISTTKLVQVKPATCTKLLITLDPVADGVFHNKLFIIDPAYGGAQSGAVGPSGLSAAQVNLKVGLELQQLLRQAGANVIMTRTDNTSLLSDQEKAVLDATTDNDLFLIINFGRAVDSTQNYMAIYHYPGQRISLSKHILDSLQKKFGYPFIPYIGQYGKDGLIDNSDYLIVQSYGIRIEPSLISNPEEETRLKNESYLREIAQAIYDGLLAYYKEQLK
ncbi:MAG: N-acetylmuramoyl-L-alanine amidase [bacterium]|nr:N-acetylmuramoyl-L-alanine amidase [bacterium]